MLKLLVALAFLTAAPVYAQSSGYVVAMEKEIALLDAAGTTPELEAVSSAFAKLGDAEHTQWLPYYYAALADTRIGWLDKKVDKDDLADKIYALVAKAEAIEKSSELAILTHMAATQQMLVDPQTRWQTFGQKASHALETAIKLDPGNPRAYYMQGMAVFGTPEGFGGGKANARPLFQKAVDLFKAAKPKPLYPSWGRQSAEDMLAKSQ